MAELDVWLAPQLRTFRLQQALRFGAVPNVELRYGSQDKLASDSAPNDAPPPDVLMLAVQTF